MDDVIGSLDDLSPERLTAALGGAASTTPRVVSVRTLLAKERPYSTVARLQVAYSAGSGGHLPEHFFLKIIRHDPTLDAASSEVEFYRRVAPAMTAAPIVACFSAATSSDTGLSHLLLADITDSHAQPKQKSAPGDRATRRALEALAVCHARNWNESEKEKRVEAHFDRESLKTFVTRLENSVSDFVRAAELSEKQRRYYRLLLENAGSIWGRLCDPADLTVTHGDCHWWNFMWPRDEDHGDVYVIDWHLWHADLAARDLAFLLALGGFAEPRPRSEPQFLKTYWNALVANGVSGYGFDQLVTDYRWSAIRNLNIPVIFRSQGKHYSTWQTALRRAVEAFERLDCEGLLA